MAPIRRSTRRASAPLLAPLAFLAPLVALCTSCSDGEASGGPRAAGAPVLLIVLDALHAEHLSHLGYERETTPNLDRLAADGISFAQAFSTAPYTRAGIPSIHTGRLPDVHGMTSGDQSLPLSEVTLAELFAEAGYRTRAAIANLNGSELYHIDQGFEEFDNYLMPRNGRSEDFETRGTWFHQPKAEEYVPLVARWLDEDGGAPGFYYLHFLEPHSPYYPPDAFRERWLDPAYDGIFAAGHTSDLVATVKGEIFADERDIEAITALYDATLAYADAQVGRILDDLERRGLYDDMLIVVTSDHGEAMFQRGRWGHNDQLYDEMVHIPLIVKLPGSHEYVDGARSALVSCLDIAPSLMEWCGLEPPAAPLDGLSLEPLMFVDDEEAFDRDRELILRTNELEPDLGLRTARDKTIVLRFPKGKIQRVEHFDLRRDPSEKNDIRKTAGELPAQRTKRLMEYRAAAAERLAGRPSAELTEAERALLVELGYADESEAPNSDPAAAPSDGR
jgi:arylsulfatase A-like enzyme